MTRVVLLVCLIGCPSPTPVGTPPPYMATCDAAEPVACPTEITGDLGLFDAVSAGGVTQTVEGNDWLSTVDATAGGFLAASESPWVYLRFTDAGLEKVPVSDLDALTSTDWHVALHRFKVRLNGGVSGPSCIGSAVLPYAFEEVTLDVAAAASFIEESFYSPTCDFQDEDSGEEGAPVGIPALALQEWWEYPDCVATTGKAYAVRLASGRLLKLRIESYYGEGQEGCNADGVAGQDSGIVRMRWSFLQ